MIAGKLLIVSSELSVRDISEKPFALDPEIFMLTGYESLGYIATKSFSSLVLHNPPKGLAGKLCCGVHDETISEALWNILENSPDGFVFAFFKEKPSGEYARSISNIGISIISLDELKSLAVDLWNNRNETHGKGGNSGILTADDIRDLRRRGVKQLDPELKMTPWAAEIADSFEMRSGRPKPVILFPVNVQSVKELEKSGERLHKTAIENPDSLFIIPVPLLYHFSRLFPALKNRSVSPSVHWARQGAYTGEVSVQMLSEIGCAGAIIPPLLPYKSEANLSALISEAEKTGLTLFVTFPLEDVLKCDIMAAPTWQIVQLHTSGVLRSDVGSQGAVLGNW